MPWIWHSSLCVVPQVIPYFQHLRIMPCICQGQGIEHLAVSEVRVSSDLHPAIGVKHGKAIIWKQGFDAWTHTHMPKQNDSLKNLGVSPVKPSTHQSNETRIFSDSTCRKNVWSTHSKFRNFVRDQFRASRKLSSFQILVSSPSFALFTSWSIFIHDPTAILHAQQGIVEKKLHACMHSKNNASKSLAVWNCVCSFCTLRANLPVSSWFTSGQLLLAVCLFGVGDPYAIIHQFTDQTWAAHQPRKPSSVQNLRWKSRNIGDCLLKPSPPEVFEEDRLPALKRAHTPAQQKSMCTSSPRLLYHVEAMDSQNAKKAKDQPGQVKLETSKIWTKT